MRWWLVFLSVEVAACATTSRMCPREARLATEDRPTGRVEWCATSTGGTAALPVPGREFPSLLAMARPAAMTRGMHGPFTHWYPDGALESHGRYVEDGEASVPDGVWGFWYADGSRKSVGRYERGQPVGCFAVWDEQGSRVTGIVEGDQIRVEECAPPEGELAEVEERSNPRARRGVWGDLTLHALPQAGTFGASNATQLAPKPSARVSVQAVLRKRLGRFRVGPALGLRLSDTADARAYSAGAEAAFVVPLPTRRFGVEIGAQVGVQYLDVTARRMELPGSGDVSFWSPLFGGRASLSLAVLPMLSVVGGVSVDGMFTREAQQDVRYCAPLCSRAVIETWKLGGVAYGADLGLRLLIR